MSRIHVRRSKRWSRLLGVAAAVLIAAWWSALRGAATSAAEPAPPAPTPQARSVPPAPGAAPQAAPASRPGKRQARNAAWAPFFVESLDPHSRYALRDGAVSAFLDERGIALSLADGERAWGVRWSMAGARRTTPVPAGPALPGVVNDLRGDPASRRAGLKTYDRVVYRGLFDGVDMEVEPRQRGLEYTLRVAAGARVPELRFELDGARALSVDDGGASLQIDTGVGRISEGALLAYQDGRDGVRREVPVRYAYAHRKGGGLIWEYGLEIGPHDPSLPLVIDPTLVWSTYLGGGSGDSIYGIAIDAAGNRYLTGETLGSGFPIVGGFQSTISGSAQDVYITKVSGATETIVWSTYYGGSRADRGTDIAVDASSNVYVVGQTASTDIVMANGFQPIPGGGTNKEDAFILKIASNGASIIADSYLGSANDDSAQSLFLDASGNAYITGSTNSANFPTTPGAFQTTCGSCSGSAPPDAFAAKIGAAGSSLTLTWSTFLGGGSDDTGYGIVADASGVWVAGFAASSNFPTSAGAYDQSLGGSQDAFLTKLNPGGTGLVFSTYLGGSGIDSARGLAVDASGNAYVGGSTQSADFPVPGGFKTTLGGAQDMFATKLNSTGSTVLWSSYIGGSGTDTLYSLVLDAADQLFIGGTTDSPDLQLIGAIDFPLSGATDAMIVRVNAGGGGLGFSTYLGGSGVDQLYALGWDAAGNLYAAGGTNSTDFPIFGGFQPTSGGVGDGWLAKISGTGVVPPTGGGPVKLAFVPAGGQTINAGACSAAVVVQAQDGSSVPANVTSATTVSLSVSPTAGFGFYSDPGCSSSISSVTILVGTSTAPNFYFKDNTSGSYLVTAAAAGLISANQTETINPLAAAKLALLTGPFTVPAGACTANTVQRQDTYSNPVISGTTTTVNLTATAPAGFAFYSDSACSSGIAFINIGPSSSTALYYFSGVTAGSAFVTDTATGLSPVSQTETITAAAANRIMFLTAPQTVTAGSCNQATVERQDLYGNPVTSGSATVTLSVFPLTGFGFYSDAACTTASSSFIISGVSTGSFYWKGNTAGSFNVTASSAGLNPGAQTETINAGAAAALAFTTGPQSVPAGGCSGAVTVERRDSLGNAVIAGSNTVSLTEVPVTAAFLFYSESTCTTTATSVTIGAGASTANFWFKSTLAGSFTVTAAAAGLTSANQVETITAAAASAIFFTTAPQTVAAGSCNQATVERRDQYGNPVTTASATVTLTVVPLTGFGFYSNATCTTASSSFSIGAGASTGSFFWKGNAAGSFNVTASSAGLTSASQTEIINAGAAAVLAITTGPQTVPAGGCSGALTVERRDALGNAVIAGTTTVNLSETPVTAAFLFYLNVTCTGGTVTSALIGAGASTITFYFKSTLAGSFTVTAAAAGLTSANQVETITAGPDAALVFTTAPVTLSAGTCSPAAIQVQRQDALGNPTTTGSITVALSASPSTGFGFYTAAGCGTSTTSLPINAGSSSISFFIRGTTAGSVTLTASTAGLPNATQVATINAGSANTLVFVSPAQTVVHGRCSPAIVIQTQDGVGNAVAVAASTPLTLSSPQGTMTFYSNPTCATPLASPAVAAGTNSFLFYFKDTGVGSKTLNAAATGFTGASQTETLTNINPVANAGVDQSQGEAKPVTLTGLASSDGDSDPLTYQWTQTGGPAVTLSSTTASQPSFTTPTVFAATPLTFQLVVNDGAASSPADAVVVTVNNDVNEAPIANAGADQATQSGTAFMLDGRGSSDPNLSPITYAWSQTAGPPVTLADPTTSTQSLTAPTVAVSTVLTFQLVVNDGAAPSTPDTVNVTVAPPNLPTITSVPRRLTGAGVPYQYDADSKVDAIGQGPITFSLVQGPAGFSVSLAGAVAYTPAAAGTFPIRIQASNAGGNTEQAYSLKVVTAPVITSSPRLTASAFTPYQYDADGLPAAVGSPSIGWSLVQSPPGAVVVHDTGEVLWTPLAAGPAQFVLRAANAFGSDDQAFVVQVGAATPPVIDATANLRAQLGQPYAYDADGKVGVTPAGAPISVMSGPPGFRVDPLTGEVSWRPLAVGVFNVQLVAGTPPLSSAPYAFQVTVVDVPAAPPLAVATASPASGGAPLDVLLDGAASSATPGRALVMYEWDPGDGAPPIPAAQATHTYGAPGGYTPALSVTDELGQRGVATASVQVGAGGVLPPTAKLFVDSMQPQADGSVEVTLRCQCSDPQSQPLSYDWELGDGSASSAAAPVHAYQSAGTFRVQLLVSNATLSTRASIDVVVRRGSQAPPEARAYASPVRGKAPLAVQLTSSARDPDGYVLQRSWSFPDDGSSSDLPSVTHVFASPGVYPVTFQATDDDGLTSSDRVEVTVLAADGTQPPRFASLGSQLGRVGEAYSYDEDGKPTVSGDAPLSFTLESPPAGATINAQTGAIAWTPQDSGVARLVITATNSAGSATQVVLVQVQPPTTAPAGPCGCGQAGGGVPMAGLLLLLGLFVKRRYGKVEHPCRCKWP